MAETVSISLLTRIIVVPFYTWRILNELYHMYLICIWYTNTDIYMSKITNNNLILHIIRIEAWARIRLYVWMHNVFVYRRKNSKSPGDRNWIQQITKQSTLARIFCNVSLHPWIAWYTSDICIIQYDNSRTSIIKTIVIRIYAAMQ